MAQNNGSPNASFTKAEIAAFVNASAENAISFAVNRNPTTAYKFIKLNYGSDFPNYATGMETTGSTMNSMYDFLLRQYNNLTTELQQAKWLHALLYSLPNQAQVTNWTTTID